MKAVFNISMVNPGSHRKYLIPEEVGKIWCFNWSEKENRIAAGFTPRNASKGKNFPRKLILSE